LFEPGLRDEQARAVSDLADGLGDSIVKIMMRAGRGGPPPGDVQVLFHLALSALQAAANAYEAPPDEQDQILRCGRDAVLALQDASSKSGRQALVLRELDRQAAELANYVGTENEAAEESRAMHSVGVVCEWVSKRDDGRVADPEKIRTALRAWGSGRGRPRRGQQKQFPAANALLKDIGIGSPTPRALREYWTREMSTRTPAARP
jgi:hypothetical protein